jgi:hypothetical protein
MKRGLTVGLLVVALAGCQPAPLPSAGTTEVVSAPVASVSVWGEVPKQCA